MESTSNYSSTLVCKGIIVEGAAFQITPPAKWLPKRIPQAIEIQTPSKENQSKNCNPYNKSISNDALKTKPVGNDPGENRSKPLGAVDGDMLPLIMEGQNAPLPCTQS
eukprot:3561986-Amphidinium_carterae.1